MANAAVATRSKPPVVSHTIGGGESLSLFHERHDATGIMRDGPSLPGGAHPNIQLGLRDINADTARHPSQLLSARPGRDGR